MYASDAHDTMGDSEKVFMNRMSLTVRQASYVGLASVFTFVLLFVICVLLDGEWNYADDVICELGISEVPLVRALYLISCVLTGSGIVVFGYTIGRYCTHQLVRFTSLMCVVFGFVLIALGLINMDMNIEIHVQIANTIAVFGTVAMVTNAVEDLLQRRFLLVFLVVFMGALILFVGCYNFDIHQTVSVSSMLIWLVIRCVLYIRGNIEF